MSKMKKVLAVFLIGALLLGSMQGSVNAKEDELDGILAGMTLRQKITQKFMMDFRQWNDAEKKPQDMTGLKEEVADLLGEYQVGSVILFANNIKKTEDTLTLTQDMQEAAMAKGGLPLLIATDQEGGKVYRLGSGTPLPGNMALAATDDTANAKKAGQIIGQELRAVGINTTLAPVVDVNNNANNPVIGLRSFSDSATMVGNYGAQYIAGLKEYNIIGCAKHFPGHGDTETDSHTGLPEVTKTRTTLLKNELKPYTIAIQKGIDMIMSAHILYPKLDNTTILSEKTGKQERRPATLSNKILTGLLRGEMKFEGVIVTDALNMQGIANSFTMEQATVEAFKAGADIVCMPVTGVTDKKAWKTKTDSIIDAVEKAVKGGELKEADLNVSVKRILRLKKEKGILSYDKTKYTKENALNTVGSPQNLKVERQISAKAVTVIRNKKSVLPLKLKKNKKVLLLTPYENELEPMTIGFERAMAARVIPKSTRMKVFCYTSDNYKATGEIRKLLDWADYVLVNSEVGNKDAMAYETWTSMGPKEFTEYCKKKGKVSVVISVDKPYDVQLYPAANAVLAAYGSKAPNIKAGIEVAFGVYKASGKLPVKVPVFDKKSKTYTSKIKYKRGYGLTYKANRELVN